MKKIVLVMIILLFPSIVLAKDTCNNNDIKIEEITIEEKEGYTEELTPVSIENNKINLNLEMYNVGESITYKIKVKNNSNNDYYFTKDSFNLNTEYLEYEILNDNEVIKSTEEKEIELKITYKEKIPEDSYNENNMMSITLSDTPLSNPSTKRSLIFIFLVIFITMIIFIIRNKKTSKVLIGIILCFIPISIKALCTINLEINTNIAINEKEAIFLPGPEVNAKMKELAGGDIETSSYGPFYYLDENIFSIKYSKIEPLELNKEEKNIVSMPDSPYPIYMWYEEGTIYWWSEAKKPKLNKNSSSMFQYMKSLIDISDFSKFDVSNATDISAMFSHNSSLANIEPLRNWDTTNIIHMNSLFINASEIWSLSSLKMWNIANVTEMSYSFAGTALKNLKGLENWNTEKVTNMSGTFSSCGTLTTLEALKNWNTKNVTNISGMFSSCSMLSSIEALENWDVSKIQNFSKAFAYTTNLTDASAINDWDIQKTANFTYMFNATPTHPEFTKVSGTWNSVGTFTPNP